MDQNNNYNYNPQQQPPVDNQPPMGQPTYTQQPPMGQPMYGQQPPMGQPMYGQQPPMGQPMYGQPPMGQPMYGQPPMGQPPVIDPDFVHPEVQAKEDSAFGKGLASLILAELPIGSIIAIGLGSKAQALAAESKQMAAFYGVDTHGKGQAGRILGKIGKILGIVMTCIYPIYILLIAATF